MFVETNYTVSIFHEVKVVKILVSTSVLFRFHSINFRLFLCAVKVVLNAMANLKGVKETTLLEGVISIQVHDPT